MLEPEEVPNHWLAYARGTAKEKGIADAFMVISIDKHLGFLYHLYMTQYYPDIRRMDHSSSWYLSKVKIWAFFQVAATKWGLEIFKPKLGDRRGRWG
jgi:hypothetical protein